MRKIILFLIYFLFQQITFAQNVDELQQSKDFNRKAIILALKADKESLFVINGVAFTYSDSLKIDTELNKIKPNNISKMILFKNTGKISHQRNDVIIIKYTEK